MAIFELPRLMAEYLVFAPLEVSIGALAILFFYAVKEFRNGAIGRIGLVSNVFFVWQVFFRIWAGVPLWLQIYLNVGSIFALLALLSYFSGEKFGKDFGRIAFVFYGSLSIIIVVAFYLTGSIGTSAEFEKQLEIFHRVMF